MSTNLLGHIDVRHLLVKPNAMQNWPWYRKHGFKEVDRASIGPWHIDEVTRDEVVRNLVRPGYRRCCMLLEEETSKTDQ